MTTAPAISIVRVCDPQASAWTEIGRMRLARHTSVPYELVDAVLDGSYGAAANRGAAQARSEYLAIMRGDTLVGPEWLEPLLATCEHRNAVVIPCVASFEGVVFEAGHVATRHGDLIAFGRGRSLDDPCCAFVRDVSSPSPACFLLRRRAFVAAGGFDRSVSAAALVETADLGFRLRSRGHRLLFQPASIVQTPDRTDETLVPLGEPFRRRWAQALSGLPAVAAGISPRRQIEIRDGMASARLLVIDDRVPHFDRGGGDPRMHRILREIVGLWPSLRVSLFAMAPGNGAWYGRALRQAGIEVVYGEGLDEWLTARRGVFDAVLISRPRAVVDLVRASQPQARIIYDMEAVHFRRVQQMIPRASLEGARRMTTALRDLLPLEVRMIGEADVVLCVSEDDRRFARSLAPSTPSFLVSHAVDTPAALPGFDDRRDLVFFGGFWNPGSPNEDAAVHLVHHIMPLIWAKDPTIALDIIGADPTPAVRALEQSQVTVHGYVADPNRVLTRARVHVVPMRVGAGIKLRLIDSMAAGLPWVTTTIGAEGLPSGSLGPSIVGETPMEIARRTLALYTDRDLWTAVHRTLLDLAATHYSAASLRRQILAALAAVGVGPPACDETSVSIDRSIGRSVDRH